MKGGCHWMDGGLYFGALTIWQVTWDHALSLNWLGIVIYGNETSEETWIPNSWDRCSRDVAEVTALTAPTSAAATASSAATAGSIHLLIKITSFLCHRLLSFMLIPPQSFSLIKFRIPCFFHWDSSNRIGGIYSDEVQCLSVSLAAIMTMIILPIRQPMNMLKHGVKLTLAWWHVNISMVTC